MLTDLCSFLMSGTSRRSDLLARLGSGRTLTLDRHSVNQILSEHMLRKPCTLAASSTRCTLLHLVALIVLPLPSPARYNSPDRRHMYLHAKSSSREEESLASPVRDIEMESCPLEPIEIVGDYFDLLMQASSRVVVMSRCLPNSKSSDP